MKTFIRSFILRGLTACGFGPLVLAVVYLVLHAKAGVEVLAVSEVCTGILSLTALAFIAGGMNAVYQIDRLPLAVAVLIHGAVLYASYLGTYLVNGWLKHGAAPILVFSVIFAVGYLAVWAVICTLTKRHTRKINQMLQQKQERP